MCFPSQRDVRALEALRVELPPNPLHEVQRKMADEQALRPKAEMLFPPAPPRRFTTNNFGPTQCVDPNKPIGKMEDWEKHEIAHKILRDGAMARARRQASISDDFSPNDKAKLAQIYARQEMREQQYEHKKARREARRPSAIWSRLKARLARVTWDSWG